jgi:tRNA pseudouridine38-40 synthase
MVRNLKLTLSYDGSEFFGWQVQPERTTIQGALSSAIRRLTGENVLPQGSGRTDAGVHAIAQVANFATGSPIPAGNFLMALNDLLPASIRITRLEEVPLDFHARKSCRSKTYRYRMYRERICPPFLARYMWHYPYELDEDAMGEAAAFIAGEHDFTSFAAVDPERKAFTAEGDDAGPSAKGKVSNVREIFFSGWEREREEFVYTVRGSGFLHHMVRNLVGTFLLVGKRTLAPSDISGIFQARERSAAGATAPASGLYLVDVEY